MKKEELFAVIMEADAADLKALAEELRGSITHSVVKQPAQELVMFQAEESVEKIDFNVGEILVTTAHVRVGDAVGFSMVMDVDAAKALDCALLMGVYEAGLPEAEKVADLGGRMRDKRHKQLHQEREIISSTRVHFEVMGGQDANVKHNADSSED